jgi:hypothetical protein
MGEMPFLSYAQRYEDVYLSRCFAGLREGFYIDIGAGHPVHDSASFAFYLQGWRGITVEPNPRLVRLTRAVRPRDCCIEAFRPRSRRTPSRPRSNSENQQDLIASRC